MTNEQLTKTLRSARLAYQDGDNKTQFAKLIGISRQTLDAIENAQQIQNVSFKHILKYAEIVGLELKLIKSINEVQGVQNESTQHQVDVNSIIEAANASKALLAASTKEKKRLFATFSGGYEVEYKGQIVFQGIRAFAAVEKYNAIK